MKMVWLLTNGVAIFQKGVAISFSISGAPVRAKKTKNGDGTGNGAGNGDGNGNVNGNGKVTPVRCQVDAFFHKNKFYILIPPS